MDKVIIYCDGACSGNPGASGYGAVLIAGGARKEISGYLGIGTNNTAEVMAAVKALEALKRPCEVVVYSDSKYLIEGAKGNWKISTNHEQWNALDKLIAVHKITWMWLKGHSGITENERANTLANNAAFRGQA